MEDDMPTFILTINWTDQGIRAVRDAPKRSENSPRKSGSRSSKFISPLASMTSLSSPKHLSGTMSPNSRLQSVRWETCAPAPPELGPSPEGPSWCPRFRSSLGFRTGRLYAVYLVGAAWDCDARRSVVNGHCRRAPAIGGTVTVYLRRHSVSYGGRPASSSKFQ